MASGWKISLQAVKYQDATGRRTVSTLFSCASRRNAVPLQQETEKGMKRKTFGILIAVLALALAGGTGWSLRDLPQKRLLRTAENIVFADADSTERLLEQVDTTRLTESSRMLYDLLRALVYEERWYLLRADTASCLSSDAETWTFARRSDSRDKDGQAVPDDSCRLRIYHYYDEKSLGGTAGDADDLRRFGRICFALSRRQNDSIVPVQINQLFLLAIHCAETTEDHALAYRAYDKYFNRLPFHNTAYPEFYLHRALEHYRLSPDQPRWLLTMLNDYGYTVLLRAPFDLHHFGSLERIAALAARHLEAPPSPTVCDSVFLCLDSLWALPHDDFGYTCTLRISKSTFTFGEVTVPVGMYEEAQQEHHEDSTNHWRPSYESETKQEEQNFSVNRDTYLAPGYVKKSAMLQRRLMTAAIVVLVLAVLVLLLVFRWLAGNVRRRHEAERNAHQREAEQLAERLRQKDAMIAMLRGHIMDKSEILDMLEPTAGKRTVINARNWREIEMTLDTADGNFVSRLRAEHPQFSEDDIRLCMLARLQLSNAALSAIYLISVSAVQHRKQKLKKEGFGITDPAVAFDQIIADY